MKWNLDSFENNSGKTLTKIDKSNKLPYLMGDFNFDLLKHEICNFSN